MIGKFQPQPIKDQWGHKESVTYECGMCGKTTRETGLGERKMGICKKCYTEAGYMNRDIHHFANYSELPHRYFIDKLSPADSNTINPNFTDPVYGHPKEVDA